MCKNVVQILLNFDKHFLKRVLIYFYVEKVLFNTQISKFASLTSKKQLLKWSKKIRKMCKGFLPGQINIY